MTTIPNNKRIAIIGGGTNSYISNHLALSAPAYGTTAKTLLHKFQHHVDNKMEVDLYLTKMASPRASFIKSDIDTPEDVEALVDKLVADPNTRVIIFNVAMVDYKPTYLQEWRTEDKTLGEDVNTFGKYSRRISTTGTPVIDLELKPYDKIINKIRKERKDILLVGFKTTCGATKEEQFQKGLKLCKDASANIVFVNDVDKDRINLLNNIEEVINKLMDKLQNHFSYNSKIFEDTLLNNKIRITSEFNYKYSDDVNEYRKQLKELLFLTFQNNGLVTPEESSYWYNTRDEALDGLVQMVLDRSHLHFTRSTVIDSITVPWQTTRRIPSKVYTLGKVPSENITKGPREIIPNPLIPETFRIVFDWVRSQGAYKKGPTGATVGHFGIKLGTNEFLTSKRKTDFNQIEEVGLVRVITDDPDDVFGYKHFFITKEEKEQLDSIENFLHQFPNEIPTSLYPYNCLDEISPYHDREKLLEVYSTLKSKQSDKVIAFGAKPSVGGQSQRSLFDTFPNLNCIVHFHCPLKTEHRAEFNTTSQFSFECGSLECITSCITGFKEYKVSDTHSIWAGHMDYHGPNIVFNSDIDPQVVIDFINKYWDLSRKTDGLSKDNI